MPLHTFFRGSLRALNKAFAIKGCLDLDVPGSECSGGGDLAFEPDAFSSMLIDL